MRFDPDDGIAGLDRHLDRLERRRRAAAKFDRHAARNELQAATFGKRGGSGAAALVADRGDGDRASARGLSREREAKQPVGNRHERGGVLADVAQNLGMMSVQPAEQAKVGKISLFAETTEAAARHAAP